MTDETLPGLGHNTDEALTLKMRAEDLLDAADKWDKERPEITDQEMADKAAAFISQINGARKDLDNQRKQRKQPHLDAAKAVDDDYRVHLDLLEKAKKALAARLDRFLREQQEKKRRAEEEARRKAEEGARKAAEAAASASSYREQAAAEEAKRRAEQAEAEAKRVADQKVGARHAGMSRSMGLRTYKVAVIEDRGKFLRSLKDDPKLEEFLQSRAQQLVREGKTPAGVRVDTEQRAA